MNEGFNKVPEPDTYTLLQNEKERLVSLERQYADELKVNPSDAAELLDEINICKAEITRLTELLSIENNSEQLPHSTTRTIETETPRKRLDDIYKMLE
jgi:hypothetical protein